MKRLLLASVVLAGCGSSTGPTATTAVSSPSPPPALTRDGCAVGSASRGPVTDPSGPYYHQVVVARTTDGLALTDARQVLDHASVPDGVRMPDGTVRLYYVNGEEGGVWVARMDGDRVTPVGPVIVDGVAGPQGLVDPDALLLPDGRVRLTYFNGFGPPGSTPAARSMCIADSTDGERFTVVARAIRFPEGLSVTDPSVVPLSDGTWLMAVSQGRQSILARSRDGVLFEAGETLSYGGVPELATLSGGRVRLYVCGNGIEAYVSADLGRTWQREGQVNTPRFGQPIACDPSLVAGAGLFVYKTGR